MVPGRVLARRYFPMSMAGRELVPDGPIVVAANHFSNLDPVVVALAMDRPVRYLAVDELYGNSRLFDNLILWLGTIPMSRTRAPLGALRLAIAELEAGGTVGLFPEGVRVWRWGEQESNRWFRWPSPAPMKPWAGGRGVSTVGRSTSRSVSRFSPETSPGGRIRSGR